LAWLCQETADFGAARAHRCGFLGVAGAVMANACCCAFENLLDRCQVYSHIGCGCESFGIPGVALLKGSWCCVDKSLLLLVGVCRQLLHWCHVVAWLTECDWTAKSTISQQCTVLAFGFHLEYVEIPGRNLSRKHFLLKQGK